MYALDTNMLIYAHNTASPFHPHAKVFVEQVMNTRDADGHLSVCLPAQVPSPYGVSQCYHMASA